MWVIQERYWQEKPPLSQLQGIKFSLDIHLIVITKLTSQMRRLEFSLMVAEWKHSKTRLGGMSVHSVYGTSTKTFLALLCQDRLETIVQHRLAA